MSVEGSKLSWSSPGSIYICGESGLRFIPHYAVETRSHRAIFCQLISRPPLRLLHRGPSSQLFVDLQLAPKHVITRLAVSGEKIVGNPSRAADRRGLALCIYLYRRDAALVWEWRKNRSSSVRLWIDLGSYDGRSGENYASTFKYVFKIILKKWYLYFERLDLYNEQKKTELNYLLSFNKI